MKKSGILMIVPTFSPNVGGVETHLDDLVAELAKRKKQVYVHAYSPITTPGVSWIPQEDIGSVRIRRYHWFGKTLLHKLEKFPVLQFLYITPYLLFRVLLFSFFNHKKFDVIHAHGLNAALIGKIIKKIFRKRLIVSTHAVYEIGNKSKVAFLTKHILKSADKILTLSEASQRELQSFGIPDSKLKLYRYWIDLDVFKPLNIKQEKRLSLSIPDRFTVLFVGRLTEIKGVRQLADAALSLPDMNFVFIGNGPLEGFLVKQSEAEENIIFLGRVDNKKLNTYYNLADVFCIPSQYEEGFGRVVMEAVACGVPVVAARKGGIPEAVDESVAEFVDPNSENLKKAFRKMRDNKEYHFRLKSNCRKFAEEKFSSKNVQVIIDSY